MYIILSSFRPAPKYQAPPKPAASRETLDEFFSLLKQSQKPLVIVGKGNYLSVHINLPYTFVIIVRLFFWCC